MFNQKNLSSYVVLYSTVVIAQLIPDLWFDSRHFQKNSEEIFVLSRFFNITGDKKVDSRGLIMLIEPI